jgi:hypothetical protein
VDWQLTLTVLVIASAGSYLCWRAWRASRKGCGGGCGCHKTPATREPTFIPAEQLMLRRGERRK